MNRHLRRFGWLTLTLFILAAWPVVLLRLQAVPPLDVATLRAMAQAIQDEFARQHPGAQVRRLSKNEEIVLPTAPSEDDACLNRVADMLAGGAAAMPALAPDLARVRALDATLMKSWDALTTRGVIFFPLLPERNKITTDTETQMTVPNFLALQTFSKVRRVEADWAIREGRWPDALRLLESAARIGDPVRYSSTIGYLIAVATRYIGYAGYADLLRAGPPPEVARAAIDALAALRATDPVLDNWTWLAERQFFSTYFLSAPTRKSATSRAPEPNSVDVSAQSRVYFYTAVKALAAQRERIQNPALRARAKAIAGWYGKDESDRSPVMAPSAGGALKWTVVPATRQWLEAMIRKEPWVAGDVIGRTLGFTPANAARLDPYTVMQFGFAGFAVGNFLEAGVRGQIAKTKGRLVEAAFAARLYRERHGLWPSSINDLAGIMPPLPSMPSISSTSLAMPFRTNAFLPLRITERPMNPELRAALWAEVLPLRAFYAEAGANAVRPDGAFDYVDANAQSEWLKEPARVLAVQQALAAHPSLVESAQAFITSGEVTQWMDPASREKYTWWPLTPLYARVFSGGIQQDELVPLKKEFDDMKKALGWSGDPPDDLTKRAVRLKAKLRAPAKAVVIWSPGPDGRDDGGAICYDPSNGTISRGDLLVFPEPF